MATKDEIIALLEEGKLEEAEEAYRATTELSGEDTQIVEAAIAGAKAAPPSDAEAPATTLDDDEDEEDLTLLTKDQLLDRATAAGVSVPANATKADIIEAIEDATTD